MRLKKISTLAAVPFLAFSLAACGGGDGGKVSKEAFVAGYVKAAEKTGVAKDDATRDKFKQVGGCIYDEVKDKVDNDTLQAVADHDAKKKVSTKDTTAVKDAATKCITKLK